jgi:hypothetical protein
MTANDGPPADVGQVNSMTRASLENALDSSAEIFTVADGDYAVNASNLGEGWAMRAFRRRNGVWTSLHLFVNIDACSLKKAGFPDRPAERIARSFGWRSLDEPGHTRTPCWTTSSRQNSTV